MLSLNSLRSFFTTTARTALVAAAVVSGSARADVVPASLFRAHAVLQQGKPIPVWGTANDGEQVTVSLAGHDVTTTTSNGRWRVELPSLRAGGPHVLTIAGRNRLEIPDVLIGEVWICGGQSNMERQLGLRKGQPPINGWQAAAASADFPQVRHFGVAQRLASKPQSQVDGEWLVCTPQTAPEFTAVGFFFARALYLARGVPVGLIHSSWGGTPAEAWTSRAGILRQDDFGEIMTWQDKFAEDPERARAEFQETMQRWYAKHDVGSSAAEPWSAEQVDTSAWPTMPLPSFWESAGLPNVNGVVWFRREFDLPNDWIDADAELHLGAVDDADTTWVNGQLIGTTSDWQAPRIYRLEKGVLKPGRNVVAVRVLDTGGGGGLWGVQPMRLEVAGEPLRSIPLEGTWRYRLTLDFSRDPTPPPNPNASSSAPTLLYNAMIAPLQPYAIRGVIWYQGEANAGRAKQYRTLFPNLVADWREKWGAGEFPFLFVQIAPHKDMSPEIREAQRLALQTIPHSAMVVTTDIGDANDIHPPEKRLVGERLALAARAIAYGENVEHSGPLFDTCTVTGDRAVVKFKHVGKGLVAPGGELTGFSVAGADRVFQPARARIVDDTVEVRADGVATPVAVRYGWAHVPKCNLFNIDGLPASPFQTDAD